MPDFSVLSIISKEDLNIEPSFLFDTLGEHLRNGHGIHGASIFMSDLKHSGLAVGIEMPNNEIGLVDTGFLIETLKAYLSNSHGIYDAEISITN